jgi:hypothetical protein
MQIKELFQNDIYRTINGVVYADRLDSDIVWQELDEYVITKELKGHINHLFKVYSDSLEGSTGNNGVWISGFFGSGKSHFLKILSYLFENRHITRDGVTRSALEFFQEKINDSLTFSTIEEAIRVPAEVILFNIDSLSFQNDEKAATLKAFFGAFNRRRGYCFNYPHIAHVEHFLTRKGVYKSFVDAFDAISDGQWYQEREDYVFYTDDIVRAIIQVLPNQSENKQLLDWITNGERSYPLTIENFAALVAEYVEEKNRRLLFMVDEMGQFVGTHSDRMLNLQTIVENLGTRTHDKAWVFVTSQEDIDAVLGVKIQDKGNDFSKIQARFYTRPTLSSSSIAEVIQKRLLRKKTGQGTAIGAVYEAKRDILHNQLSFSSDTPTMATFTNTEDFIASYPFIPYQFNLLQDIFDAVRAVGATGLNLSKGERSMLDAFQTALKAVGESTEGTLVPLWAFFPTIQSFLDGSVARSLYNAKEIPGLKDEDHRLLETLFLIRYLRLRRVRGNVQNLAVLNLSQVDTDMVRHKRAIEESIARLEKENLISRQGDEFLFMTIEEQSISREIQNTPLAGNAEIKELADIIFKDEFDGKSRYRHDNGKSFDLQLSLDGYYLSNKGDISIDLSSPLGGMDYQNKKTNGIMASADGNRAILILPESTDYYRELTLFLKTKTYLEGPGSRKVSGSEDMILAQKANENNQRRRKLIAGINQLLASMDVCICGSVYQPSAKGGYPLLMELAKYVVGVVYKKLDLLPNPVTDWEGSIRTMLSASSAALFASGPQTTNPKALDEVRQFIDLSAQAGKTPTMADVVKRYGGAPYGWPDGNAQLLLALLFRADEVRLFRGSFLEPSKALECFIKPSLYDSVSISRSRVIGQEVLAAAQSLAQSLFQEFAPATTRELADHVRKHLGGWQARLKDWQKLVEHDPKQYPGVSTIQSVLDLILPLSQMTLADELVEAVAAKQAELEAVHSDYKRIAEFFSNQISIWRKARKLLDAIQPNRAQLEEDERAATALSQLESILGDAKPYDRIKDLAPAIDVVQQALEAAIHTARDALKKTIDEYRDQLTPLCDELGLTPEESYKVKEKLNQLHSRAPLESNLASLELLRTAQVNLAYDNAIAILQVLREAKTVAAAKKQETGKTTIRADGIGFTAETPSGQKDTSFPDKVKKPAILVESLQAKDLITPQEIRTTVEVDHLVEQLRAKLKKKLAEGKVIRIL